MKARRIVGKSMEPTYHEGEIVLFKHAKEYSTGDVVIAFIDGKEVIKRISSTSPEKVYLLGDNLAYSTDSREYGSIDKKYVLGKAIYKLPFTAKR